MQTWYYHAIHTANGLEVTVHTNTQSYPLPHVVKHSPTGFEMGYGGSGPSDLALSILVHYFRCFKNSPGVARSLAEPLYQEFKREFIAPAGRELLVTDEQIDAWFARQPVEIMSAGRGRKS
jgi:hypothetical protein